MAFEEHYLVPKHKKLTKEEKEKLLKRYNTTERELPKIMIEDPSLKNLNAEPGDIIKIERKSQTAEKAIYYRTVIKG